MALDSFVRHTTSFKRHQSEEEEDIISRLPEVIIRHIISFLPTLDAVKTSVLSKQWEFLWTSHPKLVFHLFSARDVNFVDRALLLHESRIQMFSIVCCIDRFRYVSHLKRWITALVSANVEELYLSFLDGKALISFEFPCCFFASSSLTTLSLSMPWNLKFPPSVHLSSLKHLVLYGVSFCNAESLDNLFNGCPVLETANFVRCQSICGVRISAPKLYTLEIVEEEDQDQYWLDFKILAQSLKSFHLEGGFVNTYCFHELPSLEEASVHIDNIWEEYESDRYLDCLDNLLRTICHVKKLSFSRGVIEALNNLLREVPFFNNLSVLSFDEYKAIEQHIDLDEDCTGLMKILQKSPYLETLRFMEGIVFSAHCDEDSKILNPVPPCFLSHLKRLDILVDNDGRQLLTMNAVKILLEKAAVLEKLILYLPNRWMKKPVDKEKLMKCLIEIPRASQVCQFEFVHPRTTSLY